MAQLDNHRDQQSSSDVINWLLTGPECVIGEANAASDDEPHAAQRRPAAGERVNSSR